MSASQILKDTFYREKLLSLSTTQQSLNVERKKLRELSKNPVEPEFILEGLSNLGKTADGTSYSYLSINLSGKDLYSIMVREFTKEKLRVLLIGIRRIYQFTGRECFI